MIASRQIRQILRAPIINSGIVASANFAWEGRKFNPARKQTWIRETYLPTGEQNATETDQEAFGIVVFDVFRRNSVGTEILEDKATAVGNIYLPGTVFNDDVYRVIIEQTERMARRTDDSWQWIAVHIHFRAVVI